MKTMPRKYPLPAPDGECRRRCDYCGMMWYRSDLIRDPSGYLACPDDRDGRDWVTCERDNAVAAATPTWPTKPGTDW